MKRAFAILLASFAVASAAPVHAAFHLFRIDQIYSNADGTQQYVVMRESTGSDGENFWMNNALVTSGAAQGMKQFVFPSNLPSSNTASKSVLIATSGFAALGIVAPDFTVPNNFIPTTGGTLNYANVDQIALPALPADGVTAVDRNGNPVAATPKNFAGATAMLSAPPPPNATPDLNQYGLTGSWYEPATSGQGLEMEFYPGLIAADTAFVAGAWFTFDTAPAGGVERQRWYTFNGNAQSGKANVPLTILQNVGGNFDAPPITHATAVGSATLSFSDCSNATFNYMFTDGSGRAGSIPLTRIMPNVTCVIGTTPPTNVDFAFSGNWYDPATSGQGFLFEVNPVTPFFFLTWYTYAPSGQAAGAGGQRWFTMQVGFMPGSRTITGPLLETTGGVFDQVTNPLPPTVPVGTATVTFASCTAAQLQFNFTSGGNAGEAGMITLTRVGPVPPGCSFSDPMMPGYGYGPP